MKCAVLAGKSDAIWTSVLFSVRVIAWIILLLGSIALVIVCVIVSPANQVPLKVTLIFFLVLVLAITNVVVLLVKLTTFITIVKHLF